MISLYRYRRYILANALSDIRHRYTGTGLGVFWNVINPLAQIAVYAIVFSQVMRARLPGGDASPYRWVLYLCCGLLPWVSFQECVMRGINSFLENATYLKKLPIPEQVFVARSAAAATMSLIITLLLLLSFAAVTQRPHWQWTWLAVPLVCIVWQAMGFGLGLLLGTINVFIRDVGPIVAVVFQIWMWTVPIIYLEDTLPPMFRQIILFNPPYPFVRALHDLMIYSALPPAWVWAAMLGWMVLFVVAGALVLNALRGEIRDVL